MPYSITTKDGITINNIPDEIDANSQELKQRVASIRGDQGFGERLDTEIGSIPRQLGLTARAGIEGAGEYAGIFSNPLAYLGSKATGKPLMSGGELGTWAADKLGFPAPETSRERIAGTGTKMMLAMGWQAGIANKAAQTAQGVTKEVSKSLAANPGAQMGGAAGGGTLGEYAKETGGGPASQFSAALAGSFLGAGSAMGVKKAADGLTAMAKSLKGQKLNTVDVNLKINSVLNESGLSVSDLPTVARAQLVKEMQDAAKTGRSVDPKVLQRLAEYGRVGATPTKGTVSLDPAKITKEKNIAKFGAMSQDDSLAAMARMQRDNELKLIQNLNDMGAGQAKDPLKAGENIMAALKAVDAPRSDTVTAAYQAVRASDGRYAPLNVPAFSKLANDSLDENMLGSALPAQAKNLLNQVSNGEIPLNVNTMSQLDKRLSGIARDAVSSGNKEGALAVSQIRTALHNTPIESESGNTARSMYEVARSLAKKRFDAIDKNPAMKAALDEEAPDKFVQTYILGSTKKSTAKSVQSLADDLMDDADAFNEARMQILHHLKNKALGGKMDEAANFSPTNYIRAVNNIGDRKLSAFFSTDEITDIKTIGNVAQYEKFQPTGSAVNNSNTASAFAGLLERISGSKILSRLPLGNQITEPAAQASMQIQAKDAMNPLGAAIVEAAKPSQPLPIAPLMIPGLLSTE